MNFIAKHKKQLVVIALNVIGIILCHLLLSLWTISYNNYDTSNIKEYKFKIIETKALSDDDGQELRITFKDANNIKCLVYATGDEMSKYLVGEDITVYSDDEKSYELSKHVIIEKRIGDFFYFLGTSFIAVFIIIISGVLCGFKLGLLSMIVFLLFLV